MPGDKPPFEEVWRATGGNPRLLGELYEAGWDVNGVVKRILERKRISEFIKALRDDEKEILRKALEDPDVLFTREDIPLMNKLVDMNLIMDTIPERGPQLWAGEAPPEKDPELGVGRSVAWQTPLHREAIKYALKEYG